MILIIGGAYQGKLDYSKTVLGISDAEIYFCNASKIDFSKKCIYRLEEFTRACVSENVDPVSYFSKHHELWQDSILICRDISSGVVPVNADDRAWRQANGRLCRYLSKEASRVIRIFCGLEQRLK